MSLIVQKTIVAEAKTAIVARKHHQGTGKPGPLYHKGSFIWVLPSSGGHAVFWQDEAKPSTLFWVRFFKEDDAKYEAWLDRWDAVAARTLGDGVAALYRDFFVDV